MMAGTLQNLQHLGTDLGKEIDDQVRLFYECSFEISILNFSEISSDTFEETEKSQYVSSYP